jgi:phospholipid-binding lipoprotein MlaA
MKAWLTRGGALWTLALCLSFLALSARADVVDVDSSTTPLEISVPAASAPPNGAPAEPLVVTEPSEASAGEVWPEAEFDPLFDEDFEEFAGPEISDPLERGNRAVFRFNQQVDRFLWSPIITGYRFVLPARARESVRLLVRNLNSPVYLMNHLLQLRPVAAAETLSAFVVNSSFGLGGLLDAGAWVGLEPEPADFGQTLALVGVGSGPYVVIPVIGPSTMRDGFGWVVDRAFHPLTYLIGIFPQLLIEGGVGVARREEVGPKLEALEESALDYYAVIRSAYAQSRENSIDKRRAERGGGDEVETAVVAETASPEPAPVTATAQ